MLQSLFYEVTYKVSFLLKIDSNTEFFLENIAKFLKTPILRNFCKWLLLIFLWTIYFREITWKFLIKIILKHFNIISVSDFRIISQMYAGWSFCFLTVWQLIHYIADAIQRKVAAIVTSKQFMAMLSDGRQATKTGNRKELVLVRVVKNSIPVYFIVALLEMVNLGIYSGAFIMMKGNRTLAHNNTLCKS